MSGTYEPPAERTLLWCPSCGQSWERGEEPALPHIKLRGAASLADALNGCDGPVVERVYGLQPVRVVTSGASGGGL